MRTYETHEVGDLDVLLVATAGRGGGKWCNPICLNIVDLPHGTKFQRVSQRGCNVVFRRQIDGRHTGPRSSYMSYLEEVRGLAREHAYLLRTDASDFTRETLEEWCVENESLCYLIDVLQVEHVRTRQGKFVLA